MTTLDFIREFQTLITGLCAIVAAVIAYLSVLMSERYKTREQARSAAAAFWAELASIGTRMFADIRNLRKPNIGMGYIHSTPPLDMGVFDSDPLAVGRLPSDDAFAVTYVYKLIADVNHRLEQARNTHGHDDGFPQRFATEIEPVLKAIRLTLAGLRQTAGIPEDKARAAMAAWKD